MELQGLTGKGGVIDQALGARANAMAEAIHGKPTFWGTLKGFRNLDGMGRVNVVSTALVGVWVGSMLMGAVSGLFRTASSVVSGNSIQHDGRLSEPSKLKAH